MNFVVMTAPQNEKTVYDFRDTRGIAFLRQKPTQAQIDDNQNHTFHSDSNRKELNKVFGIPSSVEPVDFVAEHFDMMPQDIVDERSRSQPLSTDSFEDSQNFPLGGCTDIKRSPDAVICRNQKRSFVIGNRFVPFSPGIPICGCRCNPVLIRFAPIFFRNGFDCGIPRIGIFRSCFRYFCGKRYLSGYHLANQLLIDFGCKFSGHRLSDFKKCENFLGKRFDLRFLSKRAFGGE